jgi:methylthioribose-1-phosphate isomerase
LKIEELDDLILIWGPLSREGLSYLQEEELGKNLRVLVPENRPFMIGLMHNIPLLKKNGIRSVYCTDNMLGFLFYKRKISELLLFVRRCAKRR